MRVRHDDTEQRLACRSQFQCRRQLDFLRVLGIKRHTQIQQDPPALRRDLNAIASYLARTAVYGEEH
jgi:hypothetical protein